MVESSHPVSGSRCVESAGQTHHVVVYDEGVLVHNLLFESRPPEERWVEKVEREAGAMLAHALWTSRH